MQIFFENDKLGRKIASMKLIYLDTSHFSLLTDVFKSNPNNFYCFIEKWKKAKYVLALSKTHIEEIMPLTPETKDLRFSTLREFIPFKYENENFFQREISLTLFKRGLLQISEEDRTTSLSIFAGEILGNNDLELLKNTHNLIKAPGYIVLRPLQIEMLGRLKKRINCIFRQNQN